MQVLPSALPPAEIGTAQHKDIMFTAVAYIKLGGFDHGVSFGPEFATEALAWHWLHGLAEEACSPPPHDYIEVEPVSY